VADGMICSGTWRSIDSLARYLPRSAASRASSSCTRMPIDIAHAGFIPTLTAHLVYCCWCCCCRELGNNQLSDTIPSSLGSLVNMRELYEIAVLVVDGNVCHSLLIHQSHRVLSYNQLNGAMPSSIGSLNNLETLYVTVIPRCWINRLMLTINTPTAISTPTD